MQIKDLTPNFIASLPKVNVAIPDRIAPIKSTTPIILDPAPFTGNENNSNNSCKNGNSDLDNNLYQECNYGKSGASAE
jgi:hypothetical protein